ncbi:MAG: gas vesicle protein [Sphaerobacteraceae bacterium]|nr:MAG: gas vesicle protein [Sphaerobacteraceae bacterium]
MDEFSTRSNREVALAELLDRVIDKGVVISGDITISVADVDLIYLGLRVLLAPADRVQSKPSRDPADRGSDDMVLRVRDCSGRDIPLR